MSLTQSFHFLEWQYWHQLFIYLGELSSRIKKWQPKGLPYKVVQKVVQRMKTRCASAGLPSKGGDDETLEKGSVIQSRLCRKSFLEREIFLL
ncbi:hypothetical protein, partial [Shewanella indica]